MSSPVETERRGDVLHVTLDRPDRLNALDRATVEALHEAYAVGAAQGTRAALLAGAGRAFCGGFDLRQEGTEREHDRQIARQQELTTTLREAPFPTVCALHGHAVGGGLELALSADVVVAAADASLVFPDVRAGFAVGGGATYLLPLTVGLPRARLMLLGAEPVSGRTAHEMGMVALLSDDTQGAHALARETAERLAAMPAQALTTVRRAIDRGLGGSLASALDAELADNLLLFGSDDGRTARESFSRTGRY